MKRILNAESAKKAGKKIKVAGWVHARRDHGKLIFIDLRDASGLLQVVFGDGFSDKEKAGKLRPEWVVEIVGEVSKRPSNMVNPDLATGSVELKAEELTILNEAETPPFDITGDGQDIGEEHRLKYRYLDLRRERMQKNIRRRSKVTTFVRNCLTEKGFVEIETPILSKSTPEGARDYVVPSRLHKGKFYALPQSPQQYKQLLMVAGIERYFQIARCMRDEDTRGDRQPEFTQIDIEVSFEDQEFILNLVEDLYTKIVKKFYPDKKVTKEPWPRLNYEEVMEKYGTDSPDLRENKDNPNELAFAWIINFPLFTKQTEKDFFHGSGSAKFAPSHHMFTAPKEEDVKLLETSPEKAKSLQHDLVLNGSEIGGGSMRIHNYKIQDKVFDLIGFTKEQKEEFNHLLEAFKFGVPPHGGIAPGLDRFLSILENEANIREVIAFPKTGDGRDLIMDAPSKINEKQLEELGIDIKKED